MGRTVCTEPQCLYKGGTLHCFFFCKCKFVNTKPHNVSCVSAYTEENSSHVQGIKYLINEYIFYTFEAAKHCSMYNVWCYKYIICFALSMAFSNCNIDNISNEEGWENAT